LLSNISPLVKRDALISPIQNFLAGAGQFPSPVDDEARFFRRRGSCALHPIRTASGVPLALDERHQPIMGGNQGCTKLAKPLTHKPSFAALGPFADVGAVRVVAGNEKAALDIIAVFAGIVEGHAVGGLGEFGAHLSFSSVEPGRRPAVGLGALEFGRESPLVGVMLGLIGCGDPGGGLGRVACAIGAEPIVIRAHHIPAAQAVVGGASVAALTDVVSGSGGDLAGGVNGHGHRRLSVSSGAIPRPDISMIYKSVILCN